MEFDPFAPGYLDDPYPMFARARQDTPVFFDEQLGYWVLTRHADIKTALRDPETFSSLNATDPFTPVHPETARVFKEGGYGMRRVLLNNVPPDHARVRAPVYAAFTPQRVARLEPVIGALTKVRIDRLREALAQGPADVVTHLTYDLPALVIFALIGLPEHEMPAVKAGSESRVLFTWGKPTPGQQVKLARDMVDFWQLSERFVARRLREPQDDFTSDLIRARNGDDAVLSVAEIVSVVFGLLLAGHETTTGMLTNAIRRMLEADGLWSRLARDASLLPAAVEEALRHDASVIAMRRMVTRPVEMGGVQLPAGANVLLLIGSANHDEALFGCPHQFDAGRGNAREHLSFGFGSHYCLGAPLARLEARVVLSGLIEAFPGLQLAPDQVFEYLPNTSFRGPRALRVKLP